MANIVPSYRKIKFRIGSTLSFIYIFIFNFRFKPDKLFKRTLYKLSAVNVLFWNTRISFQYCLLFIVKFENIVFIFV